MMHGDRLVTALIKGGEKYIFLYDEQHRSQTMFAIGRMAANQDLSLTWYDAAVLAQHVREQVNTERSRRW